MGKYVLMLCEGEWEVGGKWVEVGGDEWKADGGRWR